VKPDHEYDVIPRLKGNAGETRNRAAEFYFNGTRLVRSVQ